MTKRCTTTRYATINGTRLSFMISEDAVWVYSKTANLGGWKIARYGSALSRAWIRAWAKDNVTDATVSFD